MARDNQHEVTRQPPAPRQSPPAQQGPSVADLIDQAEAALLLLKRGYAGYNAMVSALNTVQGKLQPGERPRGLPILTHKATVNGQDTIEVVIDLKKIRPDYLSGVLVPMVYAHGGDMLQAAQQLRVVADEVIALVQSAVPAAPPLPPQGGAGPAPYETITTEEPAHD